MKAWQLLSDKTKWTQGRNACDAQENPTHAHNIEAVKWCLWGAIYRCHYHEKMTNGEIENWDKMCESIREHISDGFGGASLSRWNDTSGRTFEEVHTLLKELDI